MDANELYEIANKNNIRTHFEPLQKDGAVVFFNNKFNIILSRKVLNSGIKEKETLAEEIAHCLTGTVYHFSTVDTGLGRLSISKAERTARQYASTLLVPLDELKSLLNLPTYEIADEFNVSEKTVLTAIEYYKLKGLL